ncbi:MAG: N-acetylmuramoyl-L-alanine amidase, partial [Bacteroidota bacterium]
CIVVSQTFPQVRPDSAFIVAKKDSLFLLVVVPERDTIRTPFARQRIAASTLPLARAFINDKEARVYPNGAFVGIVSVPLDTSFLRLTVLSIAGDSLWKEFVLIRPQPLKSSPRDPLVIEPDMMLPSQNLWLNKDDILELRFKGSPGYEASFDIEDVESGISMRELPPNEAGGLEGVYIGRYKVKETDEAHDVPVVFKLRKSFWSREKAESRGKVSIIPNELPRVVEVTGRRPFLNAGLGEDRLGGAKLGYIQAGVKVQVTGKVGRQYRVRLSDAVTGWLPDDFAKLLQPETPLPKSLVSSLSATGNAVQDVVTVSLGERLPYLSEQLLNPAALAVDIFGATSNTNWITHHLSAEGIQSVAWDQVSEGHYRLLIRLNYEQHWGYDIGYDGGSTLRIRLNRPPAIASPDSLLKNLIIAVDAGHGGDNQGALGATGLREMDVTLAIARHLQSMLEARGARVVMTRTDDAGPGMLDRWDAALAPMGLAGGAQILVSIHCNSIGAATDPEAVKGTSTYYRSIGFQPLAKILYDKMLELGLAQFGLIGSFNFALNAPTQFPNVLVETAFLSNPEDEMKLMDEEFRKRIAEKIVEGLEQFVKSAVRR